MSDRFFLSFRWARRLSCFVLVFALIIQTGTAQEKSADPTLQNLQTYFAEQVRSTSLKSNESIAAVTSESWPATSQKWRDELAEMLGLLPWPEKGDLRAKVVGSLDVEGVQIQRLHYQSRPGLYVPANLYLPTTKAPAKGWPAVLYVCGHARVEDTGRLWGNKTGYHHHGLWFARHGVVCLTIDTIQLGELMGEHHGTYRFGRWDWITRGYTPAGVETWNAMRGIDYLQSLPQVNSEQIGITGRSGGGAYSWYTAALDTRIKAAVPVAGITDLQNHIDDGCVSGHCDCMYMVNYFGWDYPKVAALIAPRALLLANSDNDTIFPLDGVLRTRAPLVKLYEKLGASEKFRTLITPGPHADTQELQVGAFRWLVEHLTGQPYVVELPAAKELEPQQLAVFPHETPADERVSSVGEWFVPSPATETDPAKAAELWKSKWRDELLRTTFASWPDLAKLPQEVSDLQTGLTESRTWRSRELKSQDPWTIQLLEIEPTEAASPPKITMVLADQQLWQEAMQWKTGKASLSNTLGLSALMNQFGGSRLVLVAPRGVDSTDWVGDSKTQTHRLRRFYLLGQSLESMQLFDFVHAMKAIQSSPETAGTLSLFGSGRNAPLVTLAALLGDSKVDLHLANYPTDLTLAPTLPGLLKTCDLASLQAAAQGTFQVQTVDPSSVFLQADSAVNPLPGPQQAMGIRILEVSQSAATIWARTTKWPRANLGDLPEVSFSQPAGKKRQNTGPILPATGTDGLSYAVPGIAGEIRVRYRPQGGTWQESPWTMTTLAADWSVTVPLKDLIPHTSYEVKVEARTDAASPIASTTSGSFSTLPPADKAADLRIAISTCQQFSDRDGPFGFDLYRTILKRKTNAFIHAGDVVYYDAMARSVPLANYHWQQTYGLPTLVNFHNRVPSFFLKDDHDTYVNDSWPGQQFQWTESFTFEDGQRIFRQQTALPEPAYRTRRFGKHLQIWMMEGRDYRTPNNAPDGPDKSIWGAEQWEWLTKSMSESDATFRILVSPTPVVGPDRENKNDNHSNEGFTYEGNRVRKFLASQPNTISVCGDRHWQYHSIDPVSGLHEFSVGPASDRHAGGWNPKDFKPKVHQFLRVAGGYLEVDLTHKDSAPTMVLRHLDTTGNVHHEHTMQ